MTTDHRHERPDAPPEAYTCEWCAEDAAVTADGFSWDEGETVIRVDDNGCLYEGWGGWVPTCHECRDRGGRA
jgi:hypothetical protein